MGVDLRQARKAMTADEDCIQWEQVKGFIKTMELYKLIRTKKMTEIYRAYRDDIASKGLSFNDILLLKLNWDVNELKYLNEKMYPTNDDKIKAAFSNSNLYTLRINDFPYNFESDIHHILVWSKVKLPIYLDDNSLDLHPNDPKKLPSKNKDMEKKIEDFLELNVTKKFGIPKDDYVWFINYSSLQSVKAISHVHLLLKKDDELLDERIFEENFDPIN